MKRCVLESGVLPRRRGRSLRRAALTLLFGVVLLGSAEAEVLVSNLSESADASLTVGSTDGSKFVQAIRFQTGSNERGYNLTSVKAVLSDAAPSDGVRVRIFNARSNGNPYFSLYTLTNPAISDGTADVHAAGERHPREQHPVLLDIRLNDLGRRQRLRSFGDGVGVPHQRGVRMEPEYGSAYRRERGVAVLDHP